MKRVKLSDYLKDSSQEATASQIGVIQTSISKMIRKKRNIVLTVASDGSIIDAVETRRIGKFAELEAA